MSNAGDHSATVALLEHASLLKIGLLPCPTGIVVACDPFFCAGAVPLCGAAPAGEHPVFAHRVAVPGWGKRIAAASLLWRPGPVRGLEPATLLDGSCARHFVDSGLSCFIDEAARPAFAAVLKEHAQSAPGANYYWDVLEQVFRASAVDPSDPSDPGDYCLHAFSADTTARLAMFSSGLGDGVYSTYWALGDAGRRIGLLTDFDLLSRSGLESPS
jgi:hypothetical protein